MQLLKMKITLREFTFKCFTFNVHTCAPLLLLDPYNIDESNQALKLLSVTAVVDLVLYLDL